MDEAVAPDDRFELIGEDVRPAIRIHQESINNNNNASSIEHFQSLENIEHPFGDYEEEKNFEAIHGRPSLGPAVGQRVTRIMLHRG
jgi:hypothetical protein